MVVTVEGQMNNVVPVSRDELKGLRDLVYIIRDDEAELVTLSSFRTRARAIFRDLSLAKSANNPFEIDLAIERAERELISE